MSYDANVVDKLIDVEKKILEMFQLISLYKYTDEKRYRKCLEYLNDVLLKKEDILISKLPQNYDDIVSILDIVLENKHNYFDNDKDSYLVLERFQSIMNDLLINYDEEIYEDEDYDIEIDSPKNSKMIKNNLDIGFIKSIDDIKLSNSELSVFLTNVQFMTAYKSRINTNLLLSTDFDSRKIRPFTSSELCSKLDLDKDDYNALVNDQLYDSLETLLQDFIELLNDDYDSSILKHLFLEFKYLIHNIYDSGLRVYKVYFDNTINPIKDEPAIMELNEELMKEFNNRGLQKIESNKRRQKLPLELIDKLINLIKLEGKIYSAFYDMDINNADNEKIDKLSSLLDIEKELAGEITINKSNSSVIKSVIEEDLEMFLSLDDDELKLISNRLFNLFDYFYYLNASPAQSNESYNFINRSHIINSLKKYLVLYEETSSEKDEYEKLFKNIIFTNNFLTLDYCAIRGNYKLFDFISDDIAAKLLNISELEYNYDKNEQLYERAQEIMDYIGSYDFLPGNATLSFLLCEIEDIKENMTNDYMEKFDVYELPDSIDDDDLFGRMVTEIIRENKKVRSLKNK